MRTLLASTIDRPSDKPWKRTQKTRVQMCACCNRSGGFKLPKAMQARLQAQFEGKIFEASELRDAINDNQAILSELSAPVKR